MPEHRSEDVVAAVAALRRGDFVALLDREEREGEADLLLGAQHATGERVNTMITIARGLLTVAMEEERLRQLGLPLVKPHNAPPTAPRFADPVDAVKGVTTGVSAFDRAVTLRALVDPASGPDDFARPGHVFPLAATPGGLAVRDGHTEGALAVARLAGLPPVVAMCEIMAPDGRMARGPTLREWLDLHHVVAVSVPQLIEAGAASADPAPAEPGR